MNTDKLKSFSLFLKNDCKKVTDSLFIDNLITEIEKRDKITIDVVNRWLVASFQFPYNYELDNCFDTYNRSFYHSILEKLN